MSAPAHQPDDDDADAQALDFYPGDERNPKPGRANHPARVQQSGSVRHRVPST